MGLLDDCESCFGTSDLYQLLKVDKNASEIVLKQAYKKLSLLVHPDRVSNDEKVNATKKFQVLSKTIQVLLDKDLRTVYDAEGVVDDEFAASKDNIQNWSQYWSTMFKMTIEDMKNFEETYRFSQAESDDLKAVYIECEGDIDKIFEVQICSRIEDEERFRKIIQNAIDKNEIPAFDSFTKEPKSKQKKRKRFYEREKKEAEAELKRQNLEKLDSESDLEKLIMSRQDNRKKEMDSFLNNLEAKYVKPKKKASKNTKKKT